MEYKGFGVTYFSGWNPFLIQAHLQSFLMVSLVRFSLQKGSQAGSSPLTFALCPSSWFPKDFVKQS
jgi:hypothetical protein